MPHLASITSSELPRFEAYLLADPRWQLVEDHRDGRRAVRMERVDWTGFSADRDAGVGPYKPSQNGYYSSDDGLQTRVTIYLGLKHGPDMAVRASPSLTMTSPAAGPVDVAVVQTAAQPGRWESWVAVKGACVVEIFEQRPDVARTYTEAALREVDDVFRAALAGPAPAPGRGAPSMAIEDGMQGGMYVITALANPGVPGRAYMRVFFEAADPTKGSALVPDELHGREGAELSGGRIRDRTTMRIGHSTDPAELFHYRALLTVYEGDWDSAYMARFELWFAPDSGAAERVLVSERRTISGWQQ
jgi:hypothetical protein